MIDIKGIVAKLLNIEKEISQDKGPFNFFALFLRDGYNQWDLLVSSEWIDKEKYESIRYIASKIQKKLTKEEIVDVSGIEVIDHDNPELESIYRTISTEHSIVEVVNRNFFGFTISHGYIMTSKSPLKKILI